MFLYVEHIVDIVVPLITEVVGHSPAQAILGAVFLRVDEIRE